MAGSGQSHAPVAVPSGKEPAVPVGRSARMTVRDPHVTETSWLFRSSVHILLSSVNHLIMLTI